MNDDQRRKLSHWRNIVVFLAVVAVLGLVPFPSSSQAASIRQGTDGSMAALETELFNLKDRVTQMEAHRNSIEAELKRLQGSLTFGYRDSMKIAMALRSTEEAIARAKQNIVEAAKSIYRYPEAKILTALASGDDLNETLVGRKYLVSALKHDARSLKAYRRAQQRQEKLAQELNERQNQLQLEKQLQEAKQRELDATLSAQKMALSALESKVAEAKAANALSWQNGCPLRTNLPGPYTLEDWALATLKSIAVRTRRPVADVMTQEHLVALVAFARGEGGAIQGHSGQFNPLNLNGWAHLFTDLGGVASGRGTDNWPSFDAGVEASARGLTSRQYSRLAKALINPVATADHFFAALATPHLYPGNRNWSANDAANSEKYQSILASTRSNYHRWGGEVLRANGQIVTGVPRRPQGIAAAALFESAVAACN